VRVLECHFEIIAYVHVPKRFNEFNNSLTSDHLN